MRARGKARSYPIGDAAPKNPPAYLRVVKGLTDAEVVDEVVNKRGWPEYRVALLAEFEKRGLTLPLGP